MSVTPRPECQLDECSYYMLRLHPGEELTDRILAICYLRMRAEEIDMGVRATAY